MNYKKSLLGIFSLLLIGCTQTIESDNIVRRQGLYVDLKTGNPLNGNYKSITPIGGTYSGNHESTLEYDDGIPVGEWTYNFNGDLIHSGRYLIENKLKSKINSIASSKRTDLKFWVEGDFWMLDLELYFPEKTDSITMKNIVDITNNEISHKYHYKTFDVYIVNDTTKEKVY